MRAEQLPGLYTVYFPPLTHLLSPFAMPECDSLIYLVPQRQRGTVVRRPVETGLSPEGYPARRVDRHPEEAETQVRPARRADGRRDSPEIQGAASLRKPASDFVRAFVLIDLQEKNGISERGNSTLESSTEQRLVRVGSPVVSVRDFQTRVRTQCLQTR